MREKCPEEQKDFFSNVGSLDWGGAEQSVWTLHNLALYVSSFTNNGVYRSISHAARLSSQLILDSFGSNRPRWCSPTNKNSAISTEIYELPFTSICNQAIVHG